MHCTCTLYYRMYMHNVVSDVSDVPITDISDWPIVHVYYYYFNIFVQLSIVLTTAYSVLNLCAPTVVSSLASYVSID